MDNHSRAVNYLIVRPDVENVAEATTIIAAAGEDLSGLARLLTPKQRRRILHKRAGQGAHRQAQRERRQTMLQRRLAHLAALYGS
jgi:predicted amino acid dehydrogenase